MSNSLSDNVHDVHTFSQDNDDNVKAAAKLLKLRIYYRRIHYLIHKVELNQSAKLRIANKSKENSLSNDRS